MRPKGSAKSLETRRRRAAKYLAQGKGIREVARRIGAAPSSVKRWKDAIENGGRAALNAKPHTGRPTRLSFEQRQQLLRILRQGPHTAKLADDHWTCRCVATIIRRYFGIRYHPDHVSRVLRSLGWTYQPTRKKNNQTISSRGRFCRWVQAPSCGSKRSRTKTEPQPRQEKNE